MVWSLLFIYSQVFQDNKKVSYTTSNCIWERRAKGCVLLCVADHTFGTLTKGKHALNCWKLHRKAQDLFCSLDQLLLLFPAPSFLTEKISSCENSLPNANDTVLLNSQPSRQGKKKKKACGARSKCLSSDRDSYWLQWSLDQKLKKALSSLDCLNGEYFSDA